MPINKLKSPAWDDCSMSFILSRKALPGWFAGRLCITRSAITSPFSLHLYPHYARTSNERLVPRNTFDTYLNAEAIRLTWPQSCYFWPWHPGC